MVKCFAQRIVKRLVLSGQLQQANLLIIFMQVITKNSMLPGRHFLKYSYNTGCMKQLKSLGHRKLGP